jgi:hypothetical protein
MILCFWYWNFCGGRFERKESVAQKKRKLRKIYNKSRPFPNKNQSILLNYSNLYNIIIFVSKRVTFDPTTLLYPILPSRKFNSTNFVLVKVVAIERFGADIGIGIVFPTAAEVN